MTYYRKMNAFTFVKLAQRVFASFSARVRSATCFPDCRIGLVEYQAVG